MPPSVRTHTALTTWLRERIEVDQTWVATVEEVVVGYVRFSDGWLDDLYVAPDRAGEGIGSALLDLVKSRIPDGFGLWVFEENAPAREFYARRGLVELETTDGSANDENRPDTRLVWPGPDPQGHLRAMLDDVEHHLEELRARREALESALGRVAAPVDTHG